MYNAVPIIMLRRVIDAHGGIVLRRNANSVTMPTCRFAVPFEKIAV